MTKLSIIIPCYNEVFTIKKILSKIISLKLKNIKKEIIIIDDGSTDGTKEILESYLQNKKISKIFFHKKNSGKGAAIKTGIKMISGDIIIIQDADLEYNPKDYLKLIRPIIKKKN